MITACSACGRVAFDPRSDATTGDATAGDVAADVSTLACTTRDFNTLPGDMMIYGNGVVATSNGELVMQTSGTQGSAAGIIQTTPSSYVEWSTSVHVVTAGQSETAHGWHQPGAGHSLHFKLAGGMLYLDSDGMAGNRIHAMAPHDPAEAWWRLRESSGVVHGEVSSDGVTWRLFGEIPSIDVTGTQLDIGIGTFGAPTPPDTARIDDLVVCVP